MIDDATILFSTLAVLFIIWRAVVSDRILPWFETRAQYQQAQGRQAAKLAARRKRPGDMPDNEIAQGEGARVERSGTGTPRRNAPRPDMIRSGTRR